jgi:hypothetical protein
MLRKSFKLAISLGMGGCFAMSIKAVLKGASLSLAFLSVTTPAHGYIDAGTGSLIIQGVLAAVAAVVVVGKIYWYRILRFFGVSKKNAEVEKNIQRDERKRRDTH